VGKKAGDGRTDVTREDLVGTWNLVSSEQYIDGKGPTYPWGRDAMGRVFLTANWELGASVSAFVVVG
jgi:hypothetical protein